MEKGYYVRGLRAKPGAYDTIDNIQKFALDSSDYEYFEEWVEYTFDQFASKRITELKQMLLDTDYMVIKIAEGAATFEEYADILEERQQWRAEINELETELALIEE